MSIILRPIVTEKMNAQSERLNRYGFRVARNANKVEIKKAVEEMYNVQVVDVNTLIVAPKRTSRYTRGGVIEGEKGAYKKAIVTLREGDTIDFYSNI